MYGGDACVEVIRCVYVVGMGWYGWVGVGAWSKWVCKGVSIGYVVGLGV